MLDDLRKRQKVVIYIVAAAFILTGAGGTIFGLREGLFGRGRYVGKVNGSKITVQEFQNKVAKSRRDIVTKVNRLTTVLVVGYQAQPGMSWSMKSFGSSRSRNIGSKSPTTSFSPRFKTILLKN